MLVSRGEIHPEITAVTVTAEAAGAAVVGVRGGDPRADPAAIRVLARLRPLDVVGVGAQFGPATRLGSRLAVAETGRQLPGGGQVMFPWRRLVALYGYPGTPGLGVLGQQDLTASIARAEQMAAEYQPLSRVPVVPAFEIIATVARGVAGPGRQLLVRDAGRHAAAVGQPGDRGRHVRRPRPPAGARQPARAGPALPVAARAARRRAGDRRRSGSCSPASGRCAQIGHVDVAEVNSVIGWLAALTARDHLPQKLLVLHQFQLSMIAGEQDLDTSHDDLAIVVHMDGQGTPAAKQETWNAVTGRGAARGVLRLEELPRQGPPDAHARADDDEDRRRR